MDFMFVAFAVDLALWTLAGYLVARFGGRFLPEGLRDPRLVMVAFFVVGTLVTMASFPHWLIYPR
jgi:hypothetical protein